MSRKFLILLVIALTLVAPALAHSGEDGNDRGSANQRDMMNGQHMTGNGMMGGCLNNPTCHGAADMMGYGWFGMGWPGLLIGLSLWILVLLGIVYLAKRIMEE